MKEPPEGVYVDRHKLDLMPADPGPVNGPRYLLEAMAADVLNPARAERAMEALGVELDALGLRRYTPPLRERGRIPCCIRRHYGAKHCDCSGDDERQNDPSLGPLLSPNPYAGIGTRRRSP